MSPIWAFLLELVLHLIIAWVCAIVSLFGLLICFVNAVLFLKEKDEMPPSRKNEIWIHLLILLFMKSPFIILVPLGMYAAYSVAIRDNISNAAQTLFIAAYFATMIVYLVAAYRGRS
ncbi:MAG: hypothetical protein DHS20C16_13120 [Phycisphaerae bacterium]|nr:MAG: hypothetical protein DHS20C16_13120 [Phycisphaerae bacterium]